MNETVRTLTFVWTTGSLLLSVLLVGATIALSLFAWRRSGYRASIGWLELLRVIVATLVAILFNQPEWIEEQRPDTRPTIAVLWDDSVSMQTRDVTTGAAADAPLQTRLESVEKVTQEETWKSLQERFEVKVSAIGATDATTGSNLHAPLIDTIDKTKNLVGVVLASDGDWNSGPAPIQAAAHYRMKGIPIFTVPVGRPTRLPDVELLSLDAPTFGVSGKTVRVPFTIDSALPREYVTNVVLKASDGSEVTKEVRVAPMSRTREWLIWKPTETGDFTLTLTVPKHPEETITDNNELTAPIAIRQEKLQVLVVESYPRWEYRYLRNALSRDPGVEVSCLLFHPGLSKVGGGNKDYIPKFPEGLDDLSRYDVVFLGDVGTDANQLTVEQCRLLKGLVEHQASGLVFMPGWQGRQLSLMDTALAELYPVVLDEGQPEGWGSRTPGHFELTETGRRSLLTKLADTQDDNLEVWEDLPGFQWYAPVVRAKAGTEVLSVHKDMTNEFGRLPLLVTRTFGAGKVLFMGTDGAWRWRKGVEDKYHYRFWGQVVRWMAYQRNMAKGETMRLYYSPDQPQVRQTVALHANVMDRGGEPLTQGEVTAKVTAPSGKTELVRLTSTGDEWGVFNGSYTTAEPGKHDVLLACRQTGATLNASFFVQGGDAERVGRPARPEVLDEIARVTRGRMVSVEKADEIINSLANLTEPPPMVRRLQLWSHPLVGGLLIFLLGLFWVGRKVVGLI
ncbi:MAG: hypothetical protein ACKOBW_15125 [Planctomycetota bacterium]